MSKLSTLLRAAFRAAGITAKQAMYEGEIQHCTVIRCLNGQVKRPHQSTARALVGVATVGLGDKIAWHYAEAERLQRLAVELRAEYVQIYGSGREEDAAV